MNPALHDEPWHALHDVLVSEAVARKNHSSLLDWNTILFDFVGKGLSTRLSK